MLQAVMTGPGTIEFQEIEDPEIQEDQVLMKTKRIGVCGSDIHVYHGVHPYTSYPVVQGHEVSGEITAVGRNVEDLLVGNRITFTPQVTCGKCYPCRNAMYHICEMLRVMGFQAGGAGQEYFALPAWNVIELPEGFSFDHGTFVEPVAVGVHAIRKAGDVTGKKVLVLGAGTIGNLVAQVAKALGAEAVMITDISDYKLKKAQECGIDFMVNVSDEELERAIASHFGPDKADLILDCVGVQATADQSVSNARKGTTIVVVGVFADKPIIDLGLVQDRELNLVGSLMYQKPDFNKAIDLIASGRIKLDNLITHRFKFGQYLDAYQTIDEANGHCMKVIIEMD